MNLRRSKKEFKKFSGGESANTQFRYIALLGVTQADDTSQYGLIISLMYQIIHYPYFVRLETELLVLLLTLFLFIVVFINNFVLFIYAAFSEWF